MSELGKKWGAINWKTRPMDEKWRESLRAAHKARRGIPVHHNWTEQSREKSSAKHKGQPAWNKGLTKETDARVALLAEKRKLQYPPTKGKKRNKSWNDKLRFANTSIEKLSQASLLSRGIGFITQYWIDGVTTDLALIDERIAIFCDGCYWHGCPKDKSGEYRIRVSSGKTISIEDRRLKDVLDSRYLEGKGWKVLRFWEHEIKANPDIVGLKVAEIKIYPLEAEIAIRTPGQDI